MLNLFVILYNLVISIYSFHLNTIDGNALSMSTLEGRYVLIVNVAGNSSYTNQLGGLSELHTRYNDSLTIILFPSNSFGNEPRSNAEISNYFDTLYAGKFLLSEKVNVANGTISPIFGWLSNKSLNGIVDGPVTSDFQKFLIGKNGSIIGVFAASIDPLNTKITNTIEGIE